MTSALVTSILALTWGGITYSWGSTPIISLFAASVISLILLILQERRAKEPIIPLSLFKNPIFSVSSGLSLLIGLIMLGTIIFLPIYQQIVRGDSPTASGLYLLPFVGGILVSSILSGLLITKFGKYKIYPIIGTILVGIGLWLFSHVTATTSQLNLSIWMIITGLGMGLFMQVMTLAVQNSIDTRQMGTATGLVTFFRSYGSSIGTAVFGAILIGRLSYHLDKLLPSAIANKVKAGVMSGLSGSGVSLPKAIYDPVIKAFSLSFHDVFIAAIHFILVAFLLAILLKETPLRTTQQRHTANFLGE